MVTKRAIGYIGVSDPSQVEGHSLDAQRAEIGRWCEAHDYRLFDVYEDAGVSAYTDDMSKRPVFARLLADSEKDRFDIVVVHTLDRWARNVGVQAQDLATLSRTGVGFASITDLGIDYTTPAGQLILTNLGAAQQFFSAQTAIHVAKSQRYRAEQGLPVGPVPFGYHVAEPGAVPTAVAHEGDAVHEACIRRAAGQSYGAIARWLSDHHLRTRTGTAFTAHAVRDLLRNPFIKGTIVYKGATYQGKHEALVSPQLFAQVQARRNARRAVRAVYGPKPLLQGLLHFLSCGHGVQSDRHRRRTPMYRERHARDCPTNDTSRVAQPIDDQVGEILASISLPTDWQQRMTALAGRASLEIDVPALKEKRRRTTRAFGDGAYSESEYAERLAAINRQLIGAMPVEMIAVGEVAALFQDVQTQWQEATAEERRQLVAPLLDRVYVDLATNRIGAIVPVTPFSTLLQRAIDHNSRSNVVLIGPDELERLQCWSWWRRGRIELPVQTTPTRPLYVCIR